MKKTTDLVNGSPFKLIFVFTLPIICNYILQQIYSLADSAIVAMTLGDNAVTGVNLTGSLNFLILGFASGCTAGFGVLMAQYVGSKNEEKMRRSLFTSLCLTTGIALILTLFTLLFSREILIFLETDELYLAYADSYISAIFSGIICTMLYNMSAQFLFAMGDSRTPLLILAISAVINVGLNSLLFIVDLGVAWAGWATIISQGIAAVVGYIVLFKKFPQLKLKKADCSFSLRFMGRHLGMGIPMAFQFSITAIGCMMQQRAINLFPPEYAMGQTAGGRVVGIANGGIINAFGAAMATYAGQNYGAKRLDRLKLGTKHGLLVGTILTAIATAVVYLIFPVFIKVLLPDATAAVKEYAFTYVKITSCGFIFLMLIHMFRNMVQGIGKSVTSTFGGVIELFSRLVCSYTISRISFELACFCEPITWCLTGVFFAIVWAVNLKVLEKKQGIDF